MLPPVKSIQELQELLESVNRSNNRFKDKYTKPVPKDKKDASKTR